MPDPPISDVRAILMPSGDAPSPVEVALLVSSAITSLGAAYEDLLRKRILKNPISGPDQSGPDQKDLIRHTKVLLDEEALSVLLVVWRESPFVTEEDLNKAKLVRRFSTRPMTVWGLATKLATSPDELAKTNSRTRSIALAAEVYGLIEREDERDTNKPLVGTALLHQFILELCQVYLKLLADLGPLLSLINLGFDLPEQ